MMTGTEHTSLREIIYEILKTVTDPEIDSVSILDLGMVERVDVAGTAAKVSVLPTFTGCPALDIIQRDIVNAVIEVEGVEEVDSIMMQQQEALLGKLRHGHAELESLASEVSSQRAAKQRELENARRALREAEGGQS